MDECAPALTDVHRPSVGWAMFTCGALDFIHNCLVHPLLPFLPTETGDRLHYRNARWAFEGTESETPTDHYEPGPGSTRGGA